MAKPKAFISPSTQEWNRYKSGGNEEHEMRETSAFCVEFLEDHHVSVKMGGRVSWKDNSRISNAWHADIHVAIHTNAGGGHGTEVWRRTGSKQGKRLAECVYHRLAPLTPPKDRGVKSSLIYGELNTPRCPSIIVEIEYHDNKKEANDIKANHKKYGEAIAMGILDYLRPGWEEKDKPLKLEVKKVEVPVAVVPQPPEDEPLIQTHSSDEFEQPSGKPKPSIME